MRLRTSAVATAPVPSPNRKLEPYSIHIVSGDAFGPGLKFHAADAWLQTRRCVMLALMNAGAASEDTVRDHMRDIDRTLLRENLKLTAEQRLRKFAAFMQFVSELRRAGEKARRSAETKQ
jgi:hypothetical protein